MSIETCAPSESWVPKKEAFIVQEIRFLSRTLLWEGRHEGKASIDHLSDLASYRPLEIYSSKIEIIITDYWEKIK